MLHVVLLEVEELLPDSAAVAAGSTAGWAGGSTAASVLPERSAPGRWPCAPLAAASCGWGTQSCRKRRELVSVAAFTDPVKHFSSVLVFSVISAVYIQFISKVYLLKIPVNMSRMW